MDAKEIARRFCLKLWELPSYDYFYSPEGEKENLEQGYLMDIQMGLPANRETELNEIEVIATLNCNKEAFEANDEFKELARLNAQLYNLPERIALVEAHGSLSDDEKRWKFASQDKHFLVQTLVNKLDEHYSSIWLVICNEGQKPINSQKSAAFIYNSNVPAGTGIRKNSLVNLELYLPKIGYIDTYMTEHLIKQFKKELESRKINV